MHCSQLSSSNNRRLCKTVLFMRPYVAHSICFSLRYDPTGKDIVSMATALRLIHLPPPAAAIGGSGICPISADSQRNNCVTHTSTQMSLLTLAWSDCLYAFFFMCLFGSVVWQCFSFLFCKICMSWKFKSQEEQYFILCVNYWKDILCVNGSVAKIHSSDLCRDVCPLHLTQPHCLGTAGSHSLVHERFTPNCEAKALVKDSGQKYYLLQPACHHQPQQQVNNGAQTQDRLAVR